MRVFFFVLYALFTGYTSAGKKKNAPLSAYNLTDEPPSHMFKEQVSVTKIKNTFRTHCVLLRKLGYLQTRKRPMQPQSP